MNRRRTKALANLANALPGSSLSKLRWFGSASLSGVYQGLKFKIFSEPGGEDSPARITLSLFKNSNFTLTVYKESVLSEVGKKIGVVHEIKTNDELFDKEFLIFSNNSHLAVNYLSNSTIKNTLRELFSMGFNLFKIDGETLSVRKYTCPKTLDADLEPSFVIKNLERLSQLIRGL
jgi:hypothetical protein